MSTEATPTPTTRERFIASLRRDITACEGLIKAFSERLLVDPLAAFSWGDNAARAAAEAEQGGGAATGGGGFFVPGGREVAGARAIHPPSGRY